MPKPLIGLVAAMPEEIAPFLKGNPARVRLGSGGLPFYRLEKATCTVHLVVAGMGPVNAATATRQLLTAGRPDLLVSIGFCGAVTAPAAVGDLVAAARLYLFDQAGPSLRSGPLLVTDTGFTPHLERALHGMATRLFPGTFITTPVSIAKSRMVQLLPPGTPAPVLEMESCYVAQIATAEGIPFAGIRAVSDDAAEELGFDITEFTDNNLRLKPTRVLFTVLKRPHLIPQLWRLARNARLAGRSLAIALTALLENYHA
jgi:adenosylhomocysteine nucleosidase